MVDDVGHHPQPGGVAQAKVTPPRPRQHDRLGVAGPRAVLDEVVAELPQQPRGEHLRPVGQRQRVLTRVAVEPRHCELAVAVEGGATQHVASVTEDRRVGLVPGGEGVGDGVEEAGAAVGQGPDQGAHRGATRFLLGHFTGQDLEQVVVDLTLHQGRGHVPGLCDDPVGALRLIEDLGETDQVKQVGGGLHTVDEPTAPAGVDRPVGAIHGPTLTGRGAQEGAVEAVPSRARRPHVGGVEDDVGRAGADLGSAQRFGGPRRGGWGAHDGGHRLTRRSAVRR